MPRIVEHRAALPNGLIVRISIRRDPAAEPEIFATVATEIFGRPTGPDDPFPERLPPDEALLQALAYAERAGVTVIWIDDPGRHFPPEKRPVKDV